MEYVSNFLKKYGVMAGFAVLILICSLFYTGKVTYIWGVDNMHSEEYSFGAWRIFDFNGGEFSGNIFFQFPSLLLVAVNILAVFSVPLRKKYNIPTLACIAFPVSDFLLLLWIHAICFNKMKWTYEHLYNSRLSFFGWIYVLLCISFSLYIVYEALVLEKEKIPAENTSSDGQVDNKGNEQGEISQNIENQTAQSDPEKKCDDKDQTT